MSRGVRYDIPNLAELLAFESVGRHRSFARAAEELETAQPVVSRNIARLERRVSQRLFERSRSGTRPTEAGERLHAEICAALDTLRDGIVGARSAAASGERAVIACSPDVWQLLILPRLDALREALGAAAAVEVRVDRDDAEADVAFGWDAAPEAAEALTLGEAVGPVCSPGYAELHADMLNGPVAGWGGLRFLDCPPQGAGWATWEDWFAAAGRPSRRPRPRRLESYVAALHAAVSGQGLALGRRRFVAPHLLAGVLVAPGGGFVPLGGGLTVMLTAKGRAKRLARASLAFFREALGD